MSVETILGILVKMAFMIAIGYLLRKRNIITEEVQKGLSEILLKIVLPLSILDSAHYAYNSELFHGMVVVAIVSVSFYAAGLFAMTLLSRVLPLEKSRQRIFVTMTVFQNTGFVGIPVMSTLFAEQGLLMAVIFNLSYNLFMYTYGINMLSGQGGVDWKKIVRNPVTIMSVISILIFVSPFRIPEIISAPIADVGSMSVPLSMMIMGGSLAKVPLFSILKDKYSYLVSLIRLIVFPLIVLLVLKLIGVSPVTASVCVLMAALPCGTMNVIFAEKYNCAPEFASKAVFQSMTLMAVTLPLMILLVTRVFPMVS